MLHMYTNTLVEAAAQPLPPADVAIEALIDADLGLAVDSVVEGPVESAATPLSSESLVVNRWGNQMTTRCNTTHKRFAWKHVPQGMDIINQADGSLDDRN